ncbi:hypothetical protein BDY19DRAFT_162624 [Irpex rosettiformis]|uniref:Uncharacterized protein n=1 Tax=Irpex rosettiformis TaxID=378272 RepID=A0ACB8U4C3_9APHY|nr:hypothetical protein BDY19DRAFT_162624 [Irpex rosettiformis]
MDFPYIESFMGPCFVVIWLSFILYGVFLAQVYFYLITYNDSFPIKLFVILLWGLETLHVAFCIHVMYTYLLINFATPERIVRVIWSVGVSHVYATLISSRFDLCSRHRQRSIVR